MPRKIAKYEEKFIVINKKYLKKVPMNIRDSFIWSLEALTTYLPDNKYYVVNQDEPCAPNIIKFILDNESKNGVNDA